MNSLANVVIPHSLDTKRDLAKCLMAVDKVDSSGNLPAAADGFAVFPFLRRNKC
jgi:hypothetical protein